MSMRIDAAGPDDLDAVRQLFRDYESEIGIDLCFQGFEKELAGLPCAYAPPPGRLLVARLNGDIIGCIAMRPLKDSDGICEMKRLYVPPSHRKTGLGRVLVERIIVEARNAEYRAMRLDTLQTMTAAQSLYCQLGFREIPAYYPNPHLGVCYLEFDLGRQAV